MPDRDFAHSLKKMIFLNNNKFGCFKHADGILHYTGAINMDWHRVAEQCASGIFPHTIRGNFAFVWISNEHTIMAVDHICEIPLFYTNSNISTMFVDLLKTVPNPTDNTFIQTQRNFLEGFTLGNDTTIKEISRIPPCHYYHNSKTIQYINPNNYMIDSEYNDFNIADFKALLSAAVSKYYTGGKNGMLLSAGKDSAILLSELKEANLADKTRFVNIFSDNNIASEKSQVKILAEEAKIDVEYYNIEYSGDVVDADRYYSFQIDNTFGAKLLAIEAAGMSDYTIMTGEGNVLFIGYPYPYIINYCVHVTEPDPYDIARMYITEKATYGRFCSYNKEFYQSLFVTTEEKQVGEYLLEHYASLWNSMETTDTYNKIGWLSLTDTFAWRVCNYSQDQDRKWVHPYGDWDLIEHQLTMNSKDKLVDDNIKNILKESYKDSPYINVNRIWSIPKNGISVPDRRKYKQPS